MDGIVNVMKPAGMTSHDVVAKLRRVYHTKKVGHTGTLDPDAVGVLPVCVGQATRLVEYFTEKDKTYKVIMKFGAETNTQDASGEVTVETELPSLSKAEFIAVTEQFIGEIKQVPPMYSAIKINGKKLYEYARKGQKVEIEPRKIEIYNIELLNIDICEKQIEFKVDCSKGTYIRSLCEDIAVKMGTVGYMSGLQRIRVGEFKIEQAITVEELNEMQDKFITIEDVFNDKNSIVLESKRKLELFLNGVNLTYKVKDGIYKVYFENKFVGIGVANEELLKRDIVIFL